MKILIMGLAGSGKTTLAKKLTKLLQADYFNADDVRIKYDDWDFSTTGRNRQASRMRDMCEQSSRRYSIADFICPTKATRKAFEADYIIWMDTVQECESVNGPAAAGSSFDDTNKMFNKPEYVNFMVKSKDVDVWVKLVYNDIRNYLPHY